MRTQARRWRVGAAALLALGAGFGAGAEAPPAELKVGSTPWHLVDVWWSFPSNVTCESYSVEVTVEGALDPETRLYVAPVGLGRLNGTDFYGGIQTRSDGKTPEHGDRLEVIGPGAIFSRWGERSKDAIRRSLGGFHESSGHEGDFISVRQRFPWKAGTYTYAVRKLETEAAGEASHAWVGAFVRSHETGEEVYVGSLRFPGRELKLSRQLAAFVEIYGPAIPVETIPRVTVTFGGWRVNGLPVDPVAIHAAFPGDVPQRAAATLEAGRVAIRVGEAVDRKADAGTTWNGRAFVKVLRRGE